MVQPHEKTAPRLDVTHWQIFLWTDGRTDGRTDGHGMTGITIPSPDPYLLRPYGILRIPLGNPNPNPNPNRSGGEAERSGWCL